MNVTFHDGSSPFDILNQTELAILTDEHIIACALLFTAPPPLRNEFSEPWQTPHGPPQAIQVLGGMGECVNQ